MAINYLNSIDLNQNELIHGRIENQPNDTSAGTPVEGQLYFNTSTQTLKIGKDNGTNIVWADIDTDTGITSIELASGGDATSGNTITQNGTLTLSFNGQSTQYVNGEGNLVTFPTIPTVPSNIVETIVTTNGTYINLTPTTAVDGNVTITADLSAGGTPDATKYLRGDNSWEPISGIPGTYEFIISDNAPSPGPVTGTVEEDDTLVIAANADLTSNLTGQATTTKTLTVGLKVNGGTGNADNYVLNQSTGVAAADDTIPFNNFTDNANPALVTNIVNKTTFGTIPITALTAVKTYIDNAVAGGLIYQGGFDGSTGYVDGTTDYLDSRGTQIAVSRGWTYTVTVAGTFYGENVEVGDVLIAEEDLASGTGALSDWTTVQNNVDLASLTQVGIGNVNASADQEELGIAVGYSSGTAIVGLDINGLSAVTTTEDDSSVAIYDNANGVNKKIELGDLAPVLNSFTSFSGTIGNGSATSIRLEDSGAAAPNINHGLGTDSSSFMIQLVDVSSGETVYADVTRGTGGQVTIDFATAPATDNIRVLIQKIG